MIIILITNSITNIWKWWCYIRCDYRKMINTILSGIWRTRNMFLNFIYSINWISIIISFTINSWQCFYLLWCSSLICNICKCSWICSNTRYRKCFWAWNCCNYKWTIKNRRCSTSWIICACNIFYINIITRI